MLPDSVRVTISSPNLKDGMRSPSEVCEDVLRSLRGVGVPDETITPPKWFTDRDSAARPMQDRK